MIADLKPYPAYKDSGVPWLGKVPEKWEVLPALATYKPKLVKNTGMVEKTVLSLSYGRIIVKPVEKLRGLVPESFETYQIVDLGNIIVRTTDLQNDHTSLRIGHSRNRGIITSAYLCLETTDRVSNEFGYQFLNTYDLLKIIYGFGSGLRQNLDFGDIKRMPVLVPPKEEQSAIVRFLDHADRRIRRYILAKQKLIKLLEEQKQTIIHHAVTHGPDPNVRLKPSGVEWLGDVPEHWEVLRLKTLVRVIDQGVSPQAENRFADDGSWGVLKAGCVNRGVFRDTEHKRLPDDFSFDPNLGVEIGDVLVSRASGSPQLVGSVGRVQSLAYRLILSDKTFRPVFNTRADSDFMVLAMNSRYYRQQVEQAISGAEGLANNLPSSSLRAFAFAVPPVPEQRTIVEHVRGLTNKLLGTISRALREIDLLREYRIRLIADVVTGKLDVRAAAAKLPEETDEPEPLDDAETLVEGNEETEGADLDAVPEEAKA
jgi:type I restriction enzyme, S subunit